MINAPMASTPSGELSALISNLEHNVVKPALHHPNQNELEYLLDEFRTVTQEPVPPAQVYGNTDYNRTTANNPVHNRGPYSPGNNRGAAGVRASADLEAMMYSLDNTIYQESVAPTPNRRQEKLAKGICAGCRKWIGGAQKIIALGKEYHVDHFQCSSCGTVIGNKNFFEREGQPQCETCNANLFAPTCAKCGFSVVNQAVNAMKQYWHMECFVCQGCSSPFLNGSYYEKYGLPFCTICFNLEGQLLQCRSCNQAIRGSVINALGSSWHPEHFNCQYCHKPFPNNAFYELAGLPYCQVHYNLLVSGHSSN